MEELDRLKNISKLGTPTATSCPKCDNSEMSLIEGEGVDFYLCKACFRLYYEVD